MFQKHRFLPQSLPSDCELLDSNFSRNAAGTKSQKTNFCHLADFFFWQVLCGLINNIPLCIMKNKIWKQAISRIWREGKERGRRLPPGLSSICPRQRARPSQGSPCALLLSLCHWPSVISRPSDSALREAPSKRIGTEVPVTKECFLFQMNLHILIEGRCLELIQYSKLGLSI